MKTQEYQNIDPESDFRERMCGTVPLDQVMPENDCELRGDSRSLISDLVTDSRRVTPVDLPEVRERVSQVREDIRKMAREFRRHSKEPEWDLVEADILKPLNEIRRQLAEELAKLKSDKALVPIDRDPVPDKFDELVRRYYERLGKGK